MPAFALGDKIGVLGHFKMGKTYWIRQLLQGFPRSFVWDPLFEYDATPRKGLADVAKDFEATGRGIYHPPGGLNKEQLGAEFDAWVRVALRCDNALVVVDEPSLMMSASSYPAGASEIPRFIHKRNNAFAWATHRYADVPIIWRYVDHTVAFRVEQASDLRALEESLGSAAVAEIQQLQPREWYYKGRGEAGKQPPLPPPS